jgi:hypothetical protein
LNFEGDRRRSRSLAVIAVTRSTVLLEQSLALGAGRNRMGLRFCLLSRYKPIQPQQKKQKATHRLSP